MRATVFNYCLHGFRVFPGCRSVTEICRHQRIPRSTFYALADELAAYGLRRHDPRGRPVDTPKCGNALPDAEMASEADESADNFRQ